MSFFSTLSSFFTNQKSSSTSSRDVSYTHIRVRGILILVLLILGGGIYLAGILGSLNGQNNTEKKVLFVVDTSLSMSVEDIVSGSGKNISRLSLAKEVIMRQIQKGGEYGIISYARKPFLLTPLTQDQAFLARSLDSLEIIEENGGSDIVGALLLGEKIYGRTRDIELILITDGGGEIKEKLPMLQQKIHIIAVGTKNGGTMRLGEDLLGKSVLKESNGKAVVSILDRKNIQLLQKTYRSTVSYLESIPTRIMIEKNHVAKGGLLFILGSASLFIGVILPQYRRKI